MKKYRFLKVSVAVILITAMLSLTPLSVLGSSLQLTFNTKTSVSLRSVCNSTVYDEPIEVCLYLEDISEEVVEPAFKDKQVTQLNKLISNSEVSTFAMSSNELQENITKSRKIYNELYKQHNSQLASKLSISQDNIIYESRYSPLLIVSLTESEIFNLALSDNVEYIDYFTREIEPCSVTLDANDILAMQICRINEAKSTFNVDGSGVKIGIADMGVPSQEELEAASIEYIPENSYGTYAGDHPIHCIKIINNVAPGAELFFAGGNVAGGVVECVEWLLDQESMIISISMSVGAENNYTTYSKWYDHVSYQHFAMIVAASGNREDGEAIGCKDLQMAYNVITVGTLNCNNSLSYTDDILGIAQYVPTNIGPFKPDISGSYGDTSSSTALVAGSIALLLETDTSLRMCSETIKALLAASVNQASPHKYCTSDRTEARASYMQVGSGLLDVYRFLYNGTNEHYHNNTISNSTVQDVVSIAANCNVRIAFAYVQPVTVTTADHSFITSAVQGELVNYAIYVMKQGETTPIVYSNTTNNLEIVEFNSGTGGYFTIRIVPVSGTTNTVFYSVASNVEPAS